MKRKILMTAIITLGLLALLAGGVFCAGCCVFSASRHPGQKSDHFDGVRFFNPGATPQSGRQFFKWITHRQPGPWQEVTDAQPGAVPRSRVEGPELTVTFVNHATVLIQTAGLNILTDPIWSTRASPVDFAGPARMRPPGLRFEDLPPIDVVLVSHNHYDHMDLPTLTRLDQEHHPRFFTGLGNAATLAKSRIKATELDWWQSLPLSDSVTLHGAPAQHFSSRGTCDRNYTLWMGFVLTSPGGPIYFAGDTGFGSFFADIARRFGPPRLSLLPIGAYKPEWFMGPVHLSPSQAVEVHDILGSQTSIAMHFGAFRLADDGQDDPGTALAAALAAHREPRPDFRLPDHGAAIVSPPLPAPARQPELDTQAPPPHNGTKP